MNGLFHPSPAPFTGYYEQDGTMHIRCHLKKQIIVKMR